MPSDLTIIISTTDEGKLHAYLSASGKAGVLESEQPIAEQKLDLAEEFSRVQALKNFFGTVAGTAFESMFPQYAEDLPASSQSQN